MTSAANQAGAPQLPLFYRDPVPVDVNRHRDWKIKQARSFAYAAQTNAIPVVIDEFPALHAHYPLVFSTGQHPAALALVGLRPQVNIHVDAEGNWRRNYPVPAYVRRYPFILMETPDKERLVLCMDEDSSTVGLDGDFPLFDGENAAQGGNDALAFCATFNQAAQATQAFCDALKEKGLLVEQRADVVTADKQRVSLSGFAVVDESKLNELPDDVILDWRKKNWLGMIYAHLLSLNRWNELVEMATSKE